MEKELGTEFHTYSPCKRVPGAYPAQALVEAGEKTNTPAVLKRGQRAGPSKPKSACTVFVQMLSSTGNRAVRV